MFHLNSVICINIEVCIISEYKYRYFDLIYTIKNGENHNLCCKTCF